MMSAKYFEYYTIILRGPFFRGHSVYYYESNATITNIHRSMPHIMAGKQRYDAKKLRHC